VAALDKIVAVDSDGKRTMSEYIEARYVRIQIDTVTKITVKDCVVGISALEKRIEGSAAFVPVVIPQLIFLREEPFQVYPNMPRMVDFLLANKSENKLSLANNIPWPFILSKVFEDKGTYRFTFIVNGEGVSVSKTVDIIWNGYWDAITGREV
jgi:hypothetical protein